MRHAHEAEPAPAVPPGICDGRVTNGQQSTDPNGAGGGSHQYLLAPTVGVPEGPLTSVRGETPSPVGGAPLGSQSATGTGEVHEQVWKMGEMAALSRGYPHRDFRWVTRWGVPKRHHPPNHLLKVVRWETRVGAL